MNVHLDQCLNGSLAVGPTKPDVLQQPMTSMKGNVGLGSTNGLESGTGPFKRLRSQVQEKELR